MDRLAHRQDGRRAEGTAVVTLDEALKRLEKARKRLKEEQGRVARKNARERFLRYLRTAREAVDEEYPVIRKKTTRRRKPNPKRAVRGKVTIDKELHRRLLAAGVATSRFVERGSGRTATVYAPAWMPKAYGKGFTVKQIASASKSPKARRRMMTLVRLGAQKEKR